MFFRKIVRHLTLFQKYFVDFLVDSDGKLFFIELKESGQSVHVSFESPLRGS